MVGQVLDILKISGTNTVQVADSVRVAMADLGRTLPPDVRLTIVLDDSHRTRNALASVQHELMLGAVLTILIVYLFLNSWRSVITGLALPISIISAIVIEWVFDFTLNTMTLLALALSIGLLIVDQGAAHRRTSTGRPAGGDGGRLIPAARW